jgi:uncharacterized membrane protein (DUF4010 family)
MDVNSAFAALGIALALGLLVGLQRERADSALAGVRTFPLITMLGAVCAMLGDAVGTWLLPAGMLAVTAATAMGNRLRPVTDRSPGITTEIAILLMYGVGAMLWLLPQQLGVAIGVTCAVLLHFKAGLHRLVAKLNDADIHAVMQFALITFIVLPVLPDRTFGPFDVLNPRQIWWMVVLVVGLSLLGYVVYKLMPRRTGLLIAGLLGGLISSTATTASFSRRARTTPAATTTLALGISLASAVVYLRIAAEIAIVARPAFVRLAPPLGVLFVASLAGTALLWARSRESTHAESEPGNPTELRSALTFALLYAVVLLLVAGARHYLGTSGIYAVAAISGLTDMDAITLSTSRMAASGQIDTGVAWRAIVLASASNLVFKAGLAWTLGGRALFFRLLIPTASVLVAAAALAAFWPT